MPLFFPFGSPGFGLHAFSFALFACLASSEMVNDHRRKKANIFILVALVFDFIFFLLSYIDSYGTYPYFPRYVVMSIPLALALLIFNFFPSKGNKQF